MNSDVRSEYDSSSGSADEQSVLRERASRLKSTSTKSSGTSDSSSSPYSPTGSSSPLQQNHRAHQQHQKQQQLYVRTTGLDDGGGPAGSSASGGGVTSTSSVNHDATPKVSPAQDAEGGGDSLNEDTDNVGPFALWYFHTLQVCLFLNV